MKVDIVCPSKGRAKKVLTKRLFDNLILVVPESEVEEYKEFNPECEIVGTPSTVRGITPTRQFIIEKFEQPFQIDDDVKHVRKNWIEKGEKNGTVEDKKTIIEIIEQAAYITKQIGAFVYGFSKIRNPLEYNAFKPVQHTGYLNQSHLGMIKGHGLSYDLRLNEGEDHYITCLAIYKHRYIYLDNRYSFVTDENFYALGGCNDYRTVESMKKNTLMLRKMFGEVVVVKEPTKLKKRVNEGERSLSFPY